MNINQTLAKLKVLKDKGKLTNDEYDREVEFAIMIAAEESGEGTVYIGYDRRPKSKPASRELMR